MTTSKLVTLDSFADPLHARVVAQRLEAAGIHAFVNGEVAHGVDPSHADVKLEIAEEDLERARQVLATPAEPETGIQSAPDEKAPDEDLAGTPAVAERAFRAALYGLLLLPALVGMLFQLYSLWLMTKLASRDEDTDGSSTWKVYLALALNAGGLLLGALYARVVYLWVMSMFR
jgi:hypothetical protein